MPYITTGRVLLVGLAVLGLLVTAPVATAHGDEAPDTTTPTDSAAESSTGWTDWMESHMTEYMGPGAVEWMESHMGVSIEEMGSGMYGYSDYSSGTGGQYGHGC